MKRLFYFPFLLILYEFVLNLSNDMYTPAMPQIVDSLDSTYHHVQWTFTAWFAGESSLTLFLGQLSDRFGRRPLLLGGGLLFICSTLLCSVAPSVAWLIIARFFQGASVAAFMVAGYASIHELYGEKKVVYLLAWAGSISVIAPMLGPLLGGELLLIGNWRLLFSSLFVAASLLLIPLWIAMPETNLQRDPEALKLERFFQVYRTLLSNRQFFLAGFAFASLFASMLVWISASPYLLINTLHYLPIEYGWAQIPVFGGFFVGAQSVKFFLNRIKIYQIVHIGLLIALGGALALLICNIVGEKTLIALVAPMGICTYGFGFASPVLTHLTLASTREKKGAAIALFFLLISGLGAISTFVLSLFPETFLPLGVLVTLLVSSACLCLWGFERGENVK